MSKFLNSTLAIFSFVLALLGLAACSQSEPEFDPEKCFSYKFHRYKIGNAIFDLPGYVRGSGGEYKKKYIQTMKVPHDRRVEGGVYRCQMKEYVPLGTRLFDQNSNQYENLIIGFPAMLLPMHPDYVDKTHPASATLSTYRYSFEKVSLKIPKLKIYLNAFPVDSIDNITVQEFPVKPHPTLPPVEEGKFDRKFVFKLAARYQSVRCHTAGCTKMYFKEDEIIYEISPSGFIWNKDFTKRNLVPLEEVPQTAIDVLNFLRGFRNRAVEGDYQ